jgi:hypothetical protein
MGLAVGFIVVIVGAVVPGSLQKKPEGHLADNAPLLLRQLA